MWLDIVIIVLAVAISVFVIVRAIVNRKKGKMGCGYDCANCVSCSSCSNYPSKKE